MNLHTPTVPTPADDAGVTYRPLYMVDEAAPIAGTRTRLYHLLAAGDLDAVRVGRRTMVTGASLRRWVESLPRATFRGRSPRPEPRDAA